MSAQAYHRLLAGPYPSLAAGCFSPCPLLTDFNRVLMGFNRILMDFNRILMDFDRILMDIDGSQSL